jgi:CubicO group peptidase (beta-lactamase class C family)
MKYRLFCFLLAVTAFVATSARGEAQQEEFPYAIFDRYLQPLIPQIGMPGLAAIILQGGRVAWKGEYGYADAERKIPLTIDTPIPVGGVTQAVTGVLIGVCIDRYGLEIDQDIRNFVPTFPVSETRIRQVLAHASGGRFTYNPSYYSALTEVVTTPRCVNPSYRQAMSTEVLERLAMTRSVPGMDLGRPEGAAAEVQFPASVWSRYQSVLGELAVPYRIDARNRPSRSEYSGYGLDASTGLVSTASDLAKFEGELDKRNGVPLSFSTLEKMWSNNTFVFENPGTPPTTFTLTTPTGLGWFVTNESGLKVVWTFGHIPNVSSALIVKMPAKRLTLIMLANSGGLAEGYDLENANVTSSPFVKVFLRLFI